MRLSRALPGVNNITEAHLSTITSLELHGRGVTALKAGDFEGLSALELLNLYNNDLSALPAGVCSMVYQHSECSS